MKLKILLVLLGLNTLPAFAQKQPIHLADPTVFYDAGTYYLYGTGSNNGFPVYTSANLENWQAASRNALTKGESYGTAGFWAPQIFKHESKYYMAYTANEHIAIAVSKSPLGPFVQPKPQHIGLPGKQIDPYIFKDTNGQLYLYYVRLQNGNRIFVTKLKSDLSDIADTVATECISAGPLPTWENTAASNWPVTEGPTVIKIKAQYYLFFSANDFRDINYAVGYATAATPVGLWIKHNGNPIISRTNTGKNGSGHGDLLIENEKKIWYVFHTHSANNKVHPRLTGTIRLKFKRGKFVAVPASFKYLTE